MQLSELKQRGENVVVEASKGGKMLRATVPSFDNPSFYRWDAALLEGHGYAYGNPLAVYVECTTSRPTV